ncbi:MAG: hypothetical protein J7L77_07170, partial [Clostridiales bacterium]|nr:hypothetical protein [Clostridiales bacterium]
SKGGIVSDSVILGVMGLFAISVFPLMLSMSADVLGRNLQGFPLHFCRSWETEPPFLSFPQWICFTV